MKRKVGSKEQGVFMDIKKEDLRVDHTYQRDGNTAKAKKIAKQWDWVACGAIAVSMRDSDKFYVIDGQHRVLASLEIEEITTLPCIVFELGSVSKEANGFLTGQTVRTALTAVDKHRAMLAISDPVAIKTQELIDATGRNIGKTNGDINCLYAIHRAVKYYPEAIERLWPLIDEICQGNRITQRIVGGMVHLETSLIDESLLDGRNKKKLLECGYSEIVDAMAKASAYHADGGTRIWASGILKMINHKRTNLAVMKNPVQG